MYDTSCVFAACMCWRETKAEARTVVGVVNKNITLQCDLPFSDPPVVSWVDQVCSLHLLNRFDMRLCFIFLDQELISYC